jgi:phosphohistidine swiveling domain-containing protein
MTRRTGHDHDRLNAATVERPGDRFERDEAELAAASFLAREYGLPAVLATGAATQRLRDGDLVTVDGTAGVVTMNESKHRTAVQ